MTSHQKMTFRRLIRRMRPSEFHHGDCIGADYEAHVIFRRIFDDGVVIHPPADPKKRAFAGGTRVLREKSYRERNQGIVNSVDRMIATPSGYAEELRSGTWMTIRMARKARVPLEIIWPDGTLTTEDTK